MSTGCSVITKGTLTTSPRGQLELKAENLSVCGKCVVSDGYPFAPRKQYTPEYIRQYLQFRPRTNKFGSLLRVRNAAAFAINDFFNKTGFTLIHTPILTANDCEGAGEVFKVIPDNAELIKSMKREDLSPDETYFNNKVFLTVSGQLHLEAAVYGLSKVYTFGPTFRAENARSRLHLSEFYMVEAELAFCDKLDNIIEVIEDLIKNVTKYVLNRSLNDVENCRETDVNFDWLDKKFPILTFKEAANIVKDHQNELKEKFSENDGFAKEHEIFLTKYCGNIPTFVINWPTEMKPFYMKTLSNNNTKVAALDLLAPGCGEIAGGSLRENNYEILKNRIPNESHLDWYLDLRKFGGVPTGGFGLGFERYLQFILGIGNIKDIIPFPRWPHNCKL